MSLFFGLSSMPGRTFLIPTTRRSTGSSTRIPDSFMSFGEANAAVPGAGPADLRTSTRHRPAAGNPASPRSATSSAIRASGRQAQLHRSENCTNPEPCPSAGGTRPPSDPDPLLGMDFFLGSNLSLKNPNFRSLRCGECHAGGTLTDHTVEISHQSSFNDWAQEFVTGAAGQSRCSPSRSAAAGSSPASRSRGRCTENAQDGIERNIADFCTVEPCEDAHGNPIPGGVAGGFPQGQALFDNGVYNIGVTPIANDVSRGGTDAFGWPLSLARLALKNLGGVDYTPGGDDPLDDFAQPADAWESRCPHSIRVDRPHRRRAVRAERPRISRSTPASGRSRRDSAAAPYLAPWASNITVGDETNQDEVFFGLNTLMRRADPGGLRRQLRTVQPGGRRRRDVQHARSPAADGHLAQRQPRQRAGLVQGGAAAQRRDDGSVLPQRRQADAAPGARLLPAGRRLPEDQLRAPGLPDHEPARWKTRRWAG